MVERAADKADGNQKARRGEGASRAGKRRRSVDARSSHGRPSGWWCPRVWCGSGGERLGGSAAGLRRAGQAGQGRTGLAHLCLRESNSCKDQDACTSTSSVTSPRAVCRLHPLIGVSFRLGQFTVS